MAGVTLKSSAIASNEKFISPELSIFREYSKRESPLYWSIAGAYDWPIPRMQNLS